MEKEGARGSIRRLEDGVIAAPPGQTASDVCVLCDDHSEEANHLCFAYCVEIGCVDEKDKPLCVDLAVKFGELTGGDEMPWYVELVKLLDCFAINSSID